jgi:hypothetical protein
LALEYEWRMKRICLQYLLIIVSAFAIRFPIVAPEQSFLIFNAIHGHGLFVQRFNAVTKVPQIDPLVRMEQELVQHYV